MRQDANPTQRMLFADCNAAAGPGLGVGRGEARTAFSDSAFTENACEPLHRWVPWVAGFSARFVQEVLDRHLDSTKATPLVVDPFAGVGTTLLEGYKRGCDVVGFEINPYAAFAARVKLEVSHIDPAELRQRIGRYMRYMAEVTGRDGLPPRRSPPEQFKTRSPFFSPAVERKVLHSLDFIDSIEDGRIQDLFRLAFGSVMVAFSNYSYEPSLTRRRVVGKAEVADADVAAVIQSKLLAMLADVTNFKRTLGKRRRRTRSKVINASFFSAERYLSPRSIDLVVTSPPYLNNYHYPRNTRPQLHWLGLAERPSDMKSFEEENFGKLWQAVRDKPEVALAFRLPRLEQLLQQIRSSNSSRGVYGGAGWANYAACYFNDAFRFCQLLRRLLRPGARAVIVLGNSILQGVEVPTDRLFANIGEQVGLKVEAIHPLRTKRTGSSIINSSVRVNRPRKKACLYESAVEFKNRSGRRSRSEVPGRERGDRAFVAGCS